MRYEVRGDVDPRSSCIKGFVSEITEDTTPVVKIVIGDADGYISHRDIAIAEGDTSGNISFDAIIRAGEKGKEVSLRAVIASTVKRKGSNRAEMILIMDAARQGSVASLELPYEEEVGSLLMLGEEALRRAMQDYSGCDHVEYIS